MSEAREAMLTKRGELIALHPEITQASELAPLLGEYELEYWQWQVENYVRRCERAVKWQ